MVRSITVGAFRHVSQQTYEASCEQPAAKQFSQKNIYGLSADWKSSKIIFIFILLRNESVNSILSFYIYG
jgi:hypothetical protein